MGKKKNKKKGKKSSSTQPWDVYEEITTGRTKALAYIIFGIGIIILIGFVIMHS